MTLAPCFIKDAKAWVGLHHRHSGVPQGGLFACRLIDEAGETHGVGVAGRPVARGLCDGWTVEITRVCTDGCPNGCSMIYGSLCRAAKALGYRRVVTYTLAAESGASLKASGFAVAATVVADTWDRPGRKRATVKRDAGPKLRWERKT